MNIEDAIEILKNSKKLYLKEKIDSDILEEAIETLLTAYEKEKEENKKIDENWEKICDEQEEDISLKNNKILDLEFEIKKQQKEIEELRKKNEPQPDCAEPIERTEEMVNMKWVNYNYISKNKIKELREIDNIDLIQFKIKELLGE